MGSRALSISILLALSTCSHLSAVAVDRPDMLGRSHIPRTTSIEHPLQPSVGVSGMSEEATQLATSMQLIGKLERIQQIRGIAPPPSELVVLKQETLESLVMAGFEVDTVIGRIDRELANASEILAYLAERRDRAVRLNSYADFISGGITGIVSGGMKLADAGGIAPDLLDTIEGGIQTSLASWALQQQRGESRRERGIPSILMHLFGPKTEAASDYPPAVWAYLSSPLPASKNGASRLDILVARWRQLGYCFTHKGHRNDRRVQNIAGLNPRVRLTIDVLEDRIAMLNDLRATVLQMDSDLLEMTQTLHCTRSVVRPPG